MKFFGNKILVTRNFLFAGTLLLFQQAFSQDELTELTVDRPGVADSPFTVPKGEYQFEFGFDYFKRATGELYNVPVGLLRTGISQRMELRVSSKNVIDKTDAATFLGVAPLSVGIKMHIVKERKWIPETDIMTSIVIPISPSATQSKNLGYEVLLLFQHDFYPNTAINYNIGYVWDAYRGKSVFTASFCFNYLPTRRLGLFAEYFGYVPDQWPGENGIDGGMTYLLHHWLQLDISTGVSRVQEQNIFFVSSGISFRLQ